MEKIIIFLHTVLFIKSTKNWNANFAKEWQKNLNDQRNKSMSRFGCQAFWVGWIRMCD